MNEDYKEVRWVSNLAAGRLLWYGPHAPDISSLTKRLTSLRIEVSVVSTTQAAVEQLMTKKIDRLVIDVRNMPDEEEPALYQAVRRFRGYAPGNPDKTLIATIKWLRG